MNEHQSHFEDMDWQTLWELLSRIRERLDNTPYDYTECTLFVDWLREQLDLEL